MGFHEIPEGFRGSQGSFRGSQGCYRCTRGVSRDLMGFMEFWRVSGEFQVVSEAFQKGFRGARRPQGRSKEVSWDFRVFKRASGTSQGRLRGFRSISGFPRGFQEVHEGLKSVTGDFYLCVIPLDVKAPKTPRKTP